MILGENTTRKAGANGGAKEDDILVYLEKPRGSKRGTNIRDIYEVHTGSTYSIYSIYTWQRLSAKRAEDAKNIKKKLPVSDPYRHIGTSVWQNV
jgi:hypothetical protein